MPCHKCVPLHCSHSFALNDLFVPEFSIRGLPSRASFPSCVWYASRVHQHILSIVHYMVILLFRCVCYLSESLVVCASSTRFSFSRRECRPPVFFLLPPTLSHINEVNNLVWSWAQTKQTMRFSFAPARALCLCFMLREKNCTSHDHTLSHSPTDFSFDRRKRAKWGGEPIIAPIVNNTKKGVRARRHDSRPPVGNRRSSPNNIFHSPSAQGKIRLLARWRGKSRSNPWNRLALFT